MKKQLYLFSFLLSLLVFGSCSGDENSVMVGSIRGVVRNATTNKPVPGCEVLTGKNKTAITNAQGEFLLENVMAGNETLTFRATGYVNQTKNVTVAAGKTVTTNVDLTPHTITYSIYPVDPLLDFGVNTSVKTLILRNPTAAPMEYQLTSSASWISMEPTGGIIPANQEETIKVTVNRNELTEGNYEKIITLTTPSGPDNNMNIKVLVDQGKGVRPTVSTVSAKQLGVSNSIEAKGAVIEMGSTRITSYGFCYSFDAEPTLQNNLKVVDLGGLQSSSDFSSTLSDLEFDREYSIRAYATNEAGTSYGETIHVTTQKPGIKEMTTGEATAIGITSAELHGNIKVYIGEEVTEVGFLYGTTLTPSLKDVVESYSTSTTITTRNVNSTLKDLAPGTKYYYQTYALCANGTVVKGNVMPFTTKEYPTFTFDKIECTKIDVRYYHLEFEATIDPKGNTIVETGFLWNSTNSMLTMENPRHKVVCQMNGNKIYYSGDINNLDFHIYVRGYLIMSDGTVRYSGDPLRFDE